MIILWLLFIIYLVGAIWHHGLFYMAASEDEAIGGITKREKFWFPIVGAILWPALIVWLFQDLIRK